MTGLIIDSFAGGASTGMKLGSLFDGSGGFPLAGCIHGVTPVWASEIEPYPVRVTTARFPGMKHLGDVTKIDGAAIEPVDIITFGSPCQDLSVAGKQAGLHKGERSNLFFEAIRIIKEMLNSTQGEYPKTIIWENVPGAFSSNGGKDIESVLDSIQDLGFVIDMNVLDAQNMGVPQRRRRIYLLGCNVKYIAAMKNFTSWNIITQMLIEILLTILNARLGLSDTEPKNSVWRLRSLTDDGLRRKMKLFSIEGREAFNQLLNNWADTSLTYLNEPSNLECLSKKSDSTEKADTPNGESHNLMEAERLIGSISKSWQNILGESSDLTNSFTTLTAISETTESKIYGCANLLENTQRLIGHFKNCCQVSYETELFISTGRRVCIDYARARQTSGTLFDFMERVHDWDDYLRSTAETEQRFIRNTGAKCEPEVLPLKESVRGDSAESGKAGEGTAGYAEGSPGRSCKCLTPDDVQSRRVYTEDGVWPSLYGGEGGGHGYVLRQSASGDAAGSAGGSVGVECVETVTLASSAKNAEIAYNISPCLMARAGTGGNQLPLTCYPIDSHQQDSRFKICEDGVSPTVPGQMGTGGNNGPMVLEAYSVDCRNMNLTKEHGTLQAKENGGQSLNYMGAVCYPIDSHQQDSRFNICEDGVCPTVPGQMGTGGNNGPMVLETFQNTGRGWWNKSDIAQTVRTPCGGDSTKANLVITKTPRKYIIRRLTPLECLRLQGLPDGWLDGVDGSDSAKYKMLGNGIAMPNAIYVVGCAVQLLQEGKHENEG